MTKAVSKIEFCSSTAVQHGLLYGAFGPLLGYVGMLGFMWIAKAVQTGDMDASGLLLTFAFLPFAYLFAYLPAFLTGYISSYFLQRLNTPWLLTAMGMAIGTVLAGAAGWLLHADPDYMAICGGLAAAAITCFFAVSRLRRFGPPKATPG